MRGKGIFVLSAHLGFWEMVAPAIGLYRGTLHIVVRPADNPLLDRELRALRERFGNAVIPKRGAARRMIEVLREAGRIGILIDQRVQAREGIEVPFFGHPALTSPVLARLSLRTGAAVVPVTCLPRAGRPLPPRRPPGDPARGRRGGGGRRPHPALSRGRRGGHSEPPRDVALDAPAVGGAVRDALAPASRPGLLHFAPGGALMIDESRRDGMQ